MRLFCQLGAYLTCYCEATSLVIARNVSDEAISNANFLSLDGRELFAAKLQKGKARGNEKLNNSFLRRSRICSEAAKG